MKSLLRPLTLFPLAVIGLFLNSCIESSTVVRVKKDGSGQIFARTYFSPQVTGMMGMMNGMAAGLGGTPGEGAAPPAAAPSADDLLKPTRESLEKGAAGYGEGVRYKSHETGKNANGWEGYLVVYQFGDINKLKFDPSKPPGALNDLASMAPGGDAIKKKAAEATDGESPVKFSMADGVLTIETGVSPDTLKEISGGLKAPGGGGASLTGPDGAAINPAAAMQMAAGMFQGMRMAYFIRVDGEIAETNATHVDGTLITLSDIQPGKMMTDPKFQEVTEEAEKLQGELVDPAQVEAMMKKVQNIDGLKIETKEKVTVRFK